MASPGHWGFMLKMRSPTRAGGFVWKYSPLPECCNDDPFRHTATTVDTVILSSSTSVDRPHIYIYMYTSIYIHIYVCIYIYIYKHTHTHTHTHTNKHTHTHTHTNVNTNMYMQSCAYTQNFSYRMVTQPECSTHPSCTNEKSRFAYECTCIHISIHFIYLRLYI